MTREVTVINRIQNVLLLPDHTCWRKLYLALQINLWIYVSFPMTILHTLKHARVSNMTARSGTNSGKADWLHPSLIKSANQLMETKCPPSLLRIILGEYAEIAPHHWFGIKRAILQHYIRVCYKLHLDSPLSHTVLRIHLTVNFMLFYSAFKYVNAMIVLLLKWCPFTHQDGDPIAICLEKNCAINEKGERW